MDNSLPEIDFKIVAERLAQDLAHHVGEAMANAKYQYIQMQVLAEALKAERDSLLASKEASEASVEESAE